MAKIWSFNFSTSPSDEYSSLISFRTDWFDLLPVQGLSRFFFSTTVQKHQFFHAQPSLWSNFHTHNMTAGKTKGLTIQTFLAVMSLIFNILSRFVIAFLPRSIYLLISWLQSPSAVILKPKKIKSVTASIFSTSICHELMPWSLFFECWVLS